MVENFWKMDQTKMSSDDIIEKAREYFAEDFIENYEFWKNCINEINHSVSDMLASIKISADNYTPITFDGFCSRIIGDIVHTIEIHGNLVTQDTQDIVENLRDSLYHGAFASHNDRRGTVSQMRESIKNIVMS